MEQGKSKLHMQIKDVTSDFLETWDLKRAVESAPAPTLTKVLEAASENRVARAVNTSRSPLYVSSGFGDENVRADPGTGPANFPVPVPA